MCLNGAKQSRILPQSISYFLFFLGVRRSSAWSHLQVIMGACDCPFCGPHALKTSSTNNAPVSPCSLSLDASIIDGAFEDFLVRSSQHITSFGVFLKLHLCD